MTRGLEQLKSIKSFPSLVRYLRDELDWPIESDDAEDLTFEYEPEELGLDKRTAVKVKEIKQLRPLADSQPWGIFYINFEPKRLPIVALRRILRALVIRKRASGSRPQQRVWHQNDLLFVSSYGETDEREMTFAHFSENSEMGDLPTLKVLGWSAGNTVLRLEDTHTTLKEKLRWPEDEADAEGWRKSWASAFKLQYRETVRTSKDLAVKLARLAEDIRERVNAVLSVESERGELRRLYKAFQEALIHDLDEDDFADMYAQTIAYGLLSASISRQSGALVADNLKDMVPNTNPFLKELMQTFLTVGGRKGRIDFDELGINEVVELLRHTQMDEVLKDFGARNPQEDPVIHFYELFLKEYDPEKRMKRGVFYTPRPVVSFIVRSVDEILRTEFGLEDGLADTTTWGEMRRRHAGLTIPEGVGPDEPFVQILDPATGTGTFLVEVIDRIYGTLQAKWRREGKGERDMLELWNDYVPRHLLPRLHGFELMMAPYAIAHMKIGLKLTETKYTFLSSERARIYLTNTLEEPKDFSGYFEQMAPALAHEADAANKVKRGAPVNVVIGNPPYSVESMNNSRWIRGLIDTYMYVDGQHLGEKGKKNHLQDDYVKFIRAGQWYVERSGCGVLAFITNHSYINSPTFRGMRQSLIKTFSNIFELDLHGSSKKQENPPNGVKDENVFDIQQGVSLGFFVRKGEAKETKVRHENLWGTRDSHVAHAGTLNRNFGKYEWLIRNTLSTAEWAEVEYQRPLYLFVPLDEELFSEYESGIKLTELMPHYGAGIITSKDHFIIDFEDEPIRQRLEIYRDKQVSDEWVEKNLGVKSNSMWNMSEGRRKFQAKPLDDKLFVDILYRPFDPRRIYYEANVVFNMRTQVMSHMLNGMNLALSTTRSVEIGRGWEHLICTKYITQNHSVSLKEVNHLFPLYLYDNAAHGLLDQKAPTPARRRANLSYKLIAATARCLGFTFINDGVGDLGRTMGPEDVFHYVYAVLHSPAYRKRYAEFLKNDFPRIPFTSDAELFRKLCSLGADLVALHLLEDGYEAASWNASRPKGKSPLKTLITRFAGEGGAEVAKGYPKYEDCNVYVNSSRYFEDVPEGVWNFHVGGYQVCEKWLKDRRGRMLSDEDVAHYQRVVVALNETIRLMAEIDHTIEEHGGWPLVGSQETAHQQPAPDGLPFA